MKFPENMNIKLNNKNSHKKICVIHVFISSSLVSLLAQFCVQFKLTLFEQTIQLVMCTGKALWDLHAAPCSLWTVMVRWSRNFHQNNFHMFSSSSTTSSSPASLVACLCSTCRIWDFNLLIRRTNSSYRSLARSLSLCFVQLNSLYNPWQVRPSAPDPQWRFKIRSYREHVDT